jgi:hypothetical protein
MQKMKHRPFAILGINSDESREELLRVERDEKLAFPSILDGGSRSGPLATIWGVAAWPTSVLIDHEGTIQARGLNGEALDKAIELLVQKAEGPR